MPRPKISSRVVQNMIGNKWCNHSIRSGFKTLNNSFVGRTFSSEAFMEESTFLPLPCQRASSNIDGQGWMIDTTVKKSRIPGAGNGRFSNMDIAKNTIVMEKYLISMSDVTSLHDVKDDAVILFKNENEIEDFIHLYEETGNQAREDTINCLAHFIWSLETLNDKVALNFSTWSVNHGDPNRGENIRFF